MNESTEAGKPSSFRNTQFFQMMRSISSGASKISSNQMSKAQQLLEGLQSADESVQLQAAIEMCQLLVMGNEDTLAGFPSKQVVPALLFLLKNENNYELMNLSCRALTYMMEVIPRSTSIVVEAVPVLLEKVEKIECMDVAEQSLTALEMLSKRHHRSLLSAGAIQACLLYLDFFSLQAQRSALTVISNCCLSVTNSNLDIVVSSLPDLSNRLVVISDKKCIQSVVMSFSRLVDNYLSDEYKLSQIVSNGLIENLQTLLSAAPPVLPAQCIRVVIRMMSSIASKSSSIAAQLLRNGIQTTILHLLLGSQSSGSPSNISDPFSPECSLDSSPKSELKILPKNSQELLEIASLVYNLMPNSSSDEKGIFDVDDLLWTVPTGPSTLTPSPRQSVNKTSSGCSSRWMWMDDSSGLWQPYNRSQSEVIEAAFARGDQHVSMSDAMANFSVNFLTMQQMSDDGMVNSVVRVKAEQDEVSTNSLGLDMFAGSSNRSSMNEEEPMFTSDMDSMDERVLAFKDVDLCSSFIKCLFGCLYQIFCSSAGKHVKHKVLRSIERMLHLATPELLKEVLAGYSISSNIAQMLSSDDTKVAACAIQISYILMEKLPEVFATCFRREGVLHEMEKLSKLKINMDIVHKEASFKVTDFPPKILPGLMELSNSILESSVSSHEPNQRFEPDEGSLNLFYRTLQGNPFEAHMPEAALNAAYPANLALSTSMKPTTTPESSSPSDNTRIGSLYNSIVSARKDFPSSSKKKKPPPIPTTTPPSSSKRSRRTKSESAPIPELPNCAPARSEMGLNSPASATPGLHSIFSRTIFTNPFRLNHNSSPDSGSQGSLAMNASLSAQNSPAALTSAGFSSFPIAVPSPEKHNVPGSSGRHSFVGGSGSSGGGPGNFFANLKPMKWGHSNSKSRSNNHLEKIAPSNPASANSSNVSSSVKLNPPPPEFMTSYSVPAPSVLANIEAITEEKVKLWMKKKAKLFLELYANPERLSLGIEAMDTSSESSHLSNTLLTQLSELSQRLTLSKNGIAKQGQTAKIIHEYTLKEVKGYAESMRKVTSLLTEGDASPFEIMQSGFVRSLYQFLTYDAKTSESQSLSRVDRLKTFCHVFLNCPEPDNEFMPAQFDTSTSLSRNYRTGIARRSRESTSRFSNGSSGSDGGNEACPLKILTTKLISCLHQLEQFQVRITDLQSIIGSDAIPFSSLPPLMGGSALSSLSSSGASGSTAAIKFFNTHQLKCLLERHPCCKNGAKQWKGGPVKIDPLAQMHSVEKFLIAKGLVGKDSRDEYDSDDEANDVLFAMLSGHSRHSLSYNSAQHRLKLFIGQNEVPYDWTVYQAIHQLDASSPADTNSKEPSEYVEDVLGMGDAFRKARKASNNIWLKTHTIYYAAVDECPDNLTLNPEAAETSAGASWFLGGSSNSGAGRKKHGKSSSGSKQSSRALRSSSTDQLWMEGKVPTQKNPVIEQIELALGSDAKSAKPSVQDPSQEVLTLLRILHSVNNYWFTFYQMALPRYAVSPSTFLSAKIQSKISRQLQDPLGVMTGDLPKWIVEIPKKFAFLIDFETKCLLFHVTSFDRDRALLRLQEMSSLEGSERLPDSQGSSRHESSDRITPRLERKKRIVTRQYEASDTTPSGNAGVMLKEAENLLEEIGASRAVLEIQFREEVGSGLGPTLEWYTLISHHLMRKDLDMWRNSDSQSSYDLHSGGAKKVGLEFVKSVNGLFPRPYGRCVKSAFFNKLKNRFRLLGKFLARALMDNRPVDLSLSVPFFKCLLGMESSLTSADLEYIDPDLYKIYCRLQHLVVRKRQLEADASLNSSSLQLALESLTLDNSTIESLDLTFELPGYNIEMKKGGKDTVVTIHNLENYLNLLVHWTLREGVEKQFEALKEGFESVFKLDHLKFFLPEEMEELFCGASSSCDRWTPKDITDASKFDHGFTHESKAVEWFIDIICKYDMEQQRLFLQFVTGSPRLPVGGFRSLNPPLTIVRKALSNPDESPDDYLPSVMTCVNYFKLPEYSTKEIMSDRLMQAILEGQQSFDLS